MVLLFLLQILHVVSFYLALFGFVHSYDVQFYTLSVVAVAAGGK